MVLCRDSAFASYSTSDKRGRKIKRTPSTGSSRWLHLVRHVPGARVAADKPTLAYWATRGAVPERRLPAARCLVQTFLRARTGQNDLLLITQLSTIASAIQAFFVSSSFEAPGKCSTFAEHCHFRELVPRELCKLTATENLCA